MSKINKVRMVNLNYNNNSIKIDDLKFFLDNEDTMFNLRNGGGKSVLVQMIMAPLVHKKYRDLKDRKFESYFTKSIPTYILIEWKLDNDAGYVLTGMMARKREQSLEDELKENLDIVNFIYEYKSKNQHDIDSLAIIEETEGKRSTTSFAKSKKLFEDLKKSKNGNFSYYDMNNSSTSASYFTKLSNYHINHKEWENIIHKINLKESGLSELFSKAKNVEGLLKEWFLPAVEEKLTKGENRIKNFRTIVNGYINQYKENKNKLDKKVKIELFNSVAGELRKITEEIISISDERCALENEIANIRVYLEREKVKNQLAIDEFDVFLYDLDTEIKEIRYEKLSLDIYNEKDTQVELNKELDKGEEEKKREEIKENDIEKRRNILICARCYGKYTEVSKELQELEIQEKIILEENNNTMFKVEDIGFSIKTIIEKDMEELRKNITEKRDKFYCLEDEIDNIKKNISKINEVLKSLNEKKGSLESKIYAYDKEEKGFNKSYAEDLSRNIEGVYKNDLILNLEKQISDLKNDYKNKYKEAGKNLIDEMELQKVVCSKKEEIKEGLARIKAETSGKEIELNKAYKEMENRADTLRYINLDKEDIFNKTKIVEVFDSKINTLRNREKNTSKLIDSLNEELARLQTGKLLELPKELESELKKKEISIVYGMEWLKKNGYSEEENLKLIDRNPFIPYSLIMDSRDLEILNKEPLNIFTSTPIVIIKRESINSSLDFNNEGLIELNGLEFLVSFNKKLLNEEELNLLIKNKYEEIEVENKKVLNINDEIELFIEKRSSIFYSELTEESYKDLKKILSELQEKSIKLSHDLIKINMEISNIVINIGKIEKSKINFNENYSLLERKESDFRDLKSEYLSYTKSKEDLRNNEELIKLRNREEYNFNIRLEDVTKESKDVDNTVRSLESSLKELEYNMKEFLGYTKGTFIEKDKEDLIAEFNVLNKSINSTIKEIKEKINKSNCEYKKIVDELKYESERAGLIDADYTGVKYTISEMKEIDNRQKKQKQLIKDKEAQVSKINMEIVRITSQIDQGYKELKKQCNTDFLKSRDSIIIKDYEVEEVKIDIRIKEVENKKKGLSKIINNIANAISNLSEYNDLKLVDEINIYISIDELDNEIGIKKRDLRKLCDSQGKSSSELKREIDNRLLNNSVFCDDESFKDTVIVINKLAEAPKQLMEQLNIYEESFNMQMLKLSQDIEMINKEESKILENMMDYIKEVNENLAKIDSNSSIKIRNKSVKMLNVIVPKWDENIDIYKSKLKEYIEQLRDQALSNLNKNQGIEDLISNRITNYNLFNEVISVSSVNIKLYKIEEDKQRQISWNEVSTNSGGEGFLSAFVILSSLLSYMRRDSNDIFNRYESGKVIVMDNPFAQTSSAHLLKPLMEIAKKSNTQLICFTALGDDAIYNRFDNIYVLNTIQSKLKSGVKYVRSNHIKGYEDEVVLHPYLDENVNSEVMVSSRLKIEEQMKLF
ncbi:MAG: hypothetical protein RSB70_05110 [Clostridium sp.]